MTKMQFLIGFSALLLAACGGGNEEAPEAEPAATPAPTTPAEALDETLAGAHRDAVERARDQFRHPKETLLFFGVEPDMSVVEVYPGGGWYTQVLAPYLKSGDGKLYAAGPSRDDGNERLRAALDDYEKTYVKNPEVYGDVEMTVLSGDSPIAPEGAADAVLTFRNVHNWLARGTAEENFAAFYRALKPGGVLGVVEHRADGADLPHDGSTGYVYTDDVIRLATEAGFDFDRSSEINANPADMKDHPFGVWTLPPVRRSSAISGNEDPDFDRAKYEAIGESDRMTLLFRKPAAEGALFE